MLLAIDVGNTNTVFALHDGKDFVADWRCNTESVRTADQYFVWLRQLMQHRGLDPADISEVVVSNTAPATLFNLRVLCDRYFGCRPLVVGKPECVLPVDVAGQHRLGLSEIRRRPDRGRFRHRHHFRRDRP
jgi:type III pantothenate kinase